MQNWFITLRSPALISLILVLPFMLLEIMFRVATGLTAISPKYALDSTVLFGLLWLISLAFFAILMPMLRHGQAGHSLLAQPVSLLVRVVGLALFAILWGSLVMDQLPCFLGVPNCD